MRFKQDIQYIRLSTESEKEFLWALDLLTLQGSVAEPEEKNEKDEVSGVEMNTEAHDVLNLENRVMELEKLLSEAHRESELKNKVREKSLALMRQGR